VVRSGEKLAVVTGMNKAAILAMALAALSGCKGSADVIAYSADVDATKGTALFACKDSTTGSCTFRFDDPGAQPKTITVTKGEAATVTGVGAGSTYCATTGATGAACKGQSLRDGKQTIRHEKRGSL
jgi:hypothetical protein